MRRLQKSLDDAASRYAEGLAAALTDCELGNAIGRNVPPLDCSTNPGAAFSNAEARGASRVARCTSFTGLSGCATSGGTAAVQACMAGTANTAVRPFVEVAFQ